MANLDRIVNVQIALNTSGVSREGFSTGLIIGEHSHTLNRVNIYTSLEEMMSDGFSGNESLYLAAQDYFSQIPRAKEIKIGRRRCNTEIGIESILLAGTYSVLVKTKDSAGFVSTETYSFQNTGLSTAEEILTELANLIIADTNAVITAVVNDDVMTISSSNGDDYSLEVSDNLTMTATKATEDISTTMAKIVAEDNDFYGILMTSRKQEDIMALAAWVEAHRKLFVTAISEEGAKDNTVTTDTGYLLYNNNYFRTAWFFHENAETDFPDCAVMARCFAIRPGGETWALKKLDGVVPNEITETEYNAIIRKNGNTFERFRNISVTQNGKVAAGEWIDVIRFRDWLQEEIQTDVFNVMINNDKVPYTDAGIALIESAIKAALVLGQNRGGIAPLEYDDDGNRNLGYTIQVPRAANISAGQKASRILEDVSFTARLAGAIHVVEINGSLTYANLTEVATQ